MSNTQLTRQEFHQTDQQRLGFIPATKYHGKGQAIVHFLTLQELASCPNFQGEML